MAHAIKQYSIVTILEDRNVTWNNDKLKFKHIGQSKEIQRMLHVK